MNGADPKLQRRMRMTAISAGVVVVGMVGMAYAAVPLYQMFCQVTGFGGTTQVAETAPGPVSDRHMTIQFNADTAHGMPWRFRPAQRQVDVRVGQEALAFYTAKNTTDRTIVGSATYNVTPLKAGIYFNKVECFCFTEQKLEPGQEVEMPVSFFVDPEIENDPNMKEVKTITLSYTFFEVAKEEAQARLSNGASGG
jgi:cytochrome c oxidase assembly protein subunit 11